jgi:hypothetical protein
MNPIVEILMKRDNMSAEDANKLLQDARDDFYSSDEISDEFLGDWFGLEPDYIFDLI